jgi:hypothetical protein
MYQFTPVSTHIQGPFSFTYHDCQWIQVAWIWYLNFSIIQIFTWAKLTENGMDLEYPAIGWDWLTSDFYSEFLCFLWFGMKLSLYLSSNFISSPFWASFNVQATSISVYRFQVWVNLASLCSEIVCVPSTWNKRCPILAWLESCLMLPWNPSSGFTEMTCKLTTSGTCTLFLTILNKSPSLKSICVGTLSQQILINSLSILILPSKTACDTGCSVLMCLCFELKPDNLICWSAQIHRYVKVAGVSYYAGIHTGLLGFSCCHLHIWLASVWLTEISKKQPAL